MTEKTAQKEYWRGVGRRKTAVATVRLSAGEPTIEVDGEKTNLPALVFSPLELVGKKTAFGLQIKVNGGGKESRLEAIRLAIARALQSFDPEFRTVLKKAGFLSRDPREKERKKPGLKGARRAPQWAKR